MPTRRQILLALGGLTGCASAAERATPHAPTRTRPRDAFEIAMDIVETRHPDVQARVWALFHVDGARGTGAEHACRTVYGIGYFLDAAGIGADDLDRVLTLSSDAISWDSTLEAIHIFEHRMSPERAREAFDSLLEESPRSERIRGLGFPAADIIVGDAERLVAAPEPDLLVALPIGEMVGAIQLVGCGGLPRRRGAEALLAGATLPGYDSLGIEAPPTVSNARARVTLDGAGNASVYFAVDSTDPRQAELDASWLTEHVNRALTIDLKFAELRILGPYEFRANGNQVVSELRLTREEADWVVGMARTVMPGG